MIKEDIIVIPSLISFESFLGYWEIYIPEKTLLQYPILIYLRWRSGIDDVKIDFEIIDD